MFSETHDCLTNEDRPQVRGSDSRRLTSCPPAVLWSIIQAFSRAQAAGKALEVIYVPVADTMEVRADSPGLSPLPMEVMLLPTCIYSFKMFSLDEKVRWSRRIGCRVVLRLLPQR